MSDTWTFIARTDAGYGGSDNKAFNAAAMFDYRFKNWGSVFFGYRYLNYDYDYDNDNDNDNDKAEDTYAFDAYQSGPLAGNKLMIRMFQMWMLLKELRKVSL